jgi:hypothetical protein
LEDEVRSTKRIAELRQRVRDQGVWVLTLTEERDYWKAEAERLQEALERCGDPTDPWTPAAIARAAEENEPAPLTGSTAQLDAEDHAGRR